MVALGESAERLHPPPRERIGAADEGLREAGHAAEAIVVGSLLLGVLAVEGAERDRDAAGRGDALAAGDVAGVAEDLARRGAARAGRQRHQPDVLGQRHHVRPVLGEVRLDVVADHALDLAAERVVADDVGEILLVLEGEHPGAAVVGEQIDDRLGTIRGPSGRTRRLRWRPRQRIRLRLDRLGGPPCHHRVVGDQGIGSGQRRRLHVGLLVERERDDLQTERVSVGDQLRADRPLRRDVVEPAVWGDRCGGAVDVLKASGRKSCCRRSRSRPGTASGCRAESSAGSGRRAESRCP